MIELPVDAKEPNLRRLSDMKALAGDKRMISDKVKFLRHSGCVREILPMLYRDIGAALWLSR